MDNENSNVEVSHNDITVLPNDALSIITRAEIDTQIATAKAFPRSLTAFLKKALSMATVSEEVAASCAYALPRGGNTIKGPSVRLAEIVCASYGNIKAAARVILNDGKTITAQGICYDLETNYCATIEVKRKITDKNGKTYSEDMQVVTGNAACAIAFRNAVFKVVPAALVADVYEKVEEVAKGTAETLPKRLKKRLDYLYSLGVKDEQICSVLQIQDVNDIDLDKLSILQGMITALKNNESSIAEMFPEPDYKTKASKATNAAVDAIKKQAEKSAGK